LVQDINVQAFKFKHFENPPHKFFMFKMLKIQTYLNVYSSGQFLPDDISLGLNLLYSGVDTGERDGALAPPGNI